MDVLKQEKLNFYMRAYSITAALYTVVNKQLDAGLKPYGLQNMQWRLLYLIYVNEQTTSSDIAKRLGTQKASVTRLVNALESKGLIKRATDSKDRRKINIELTAKGESLTEMGIEKFSQLPEKLALALTEEEVTQVSFTQNQFVINSD